KPVQVRDLRKAIQRSRRHETTEPSGSYSAPAESPADLELDPQALDQLRTLEEGGEAGFVAELITTFLTDADRRLTALRSAVKEGEQETVRKIAHALKSASRSVGARKLAHTLAELEDSAHRGESTSALLEQVETAYTSVRPGLETAGQG